MASSLSMAQYGNPLSSTTASTTVVQLNDSGVQAPQKTVGEIVKDYFKDDPIMAKVAWCESRNRQWNKDGSIFRGKVNPSDVGVMQINTYYHEKKAKEMGIDLMTLEGNLKYGKYLYEKEGTTPWNSSSPCWANGDTNQVAVN